MRPRGFLVAIVVAVSLGACALPVRPPGPLRYLDEVFAQVDVQLGVAYGQATDEHGVAQELNLDVYAPDGDQTTGRPVVVWAHGGGFTTGHKGMMRPFAESWARRGWVSIAIEYRLREGHDFISNPDSPELRAAITDAQHDAQAAVRWVRAHAAELAVDPDRIAVVGQSAGAITALMAAYNSEDPGGSGSPGFPSQVVAAVALAGCADVSVIDAGEPPTLLFHAPDDDVVPYGCAVATRDAAVAGGNSSDLRTLPGGTHFLTKYGEYVLAWTAYFLWARVATS